jgi:hypothetical protein
VRGDKVRKARMGIGISDYRVVASMKLIFS